MVTLRRDIAAASNNQIFDRKDRDSSVLTDYDIFMEKKKQQRHLCDYKPVDDTPAKEAQPTLSYVRNRQDAFDTIFSQPNEQASSPTPKHYDTASNLLFTGTQTSPMQDDYKNYLIQQLHRQEPAELLDKDSFYKRLSPQPAAAKPARSKPQPKKLSKNGKIFIAVYVLVVAIVASIILAVNSISQPSMVDASASNDNAQGIISPMDVPTDAPSASANWFDKLLDGLSNGR